MAFITKERSESEGTAALSDVDDWEPLLIRIKANYQIEDVDERFERASKDAIRAVERVSGAYNFEPIVVATGVDCALLDNLCTSIAGFHIHVQIVDGNLLITNISTGYPHAGGVKSIIAQSSNWNDRGRFAAYSDANTKFGRRAAGAPDLTLSVDKRYVLPGAGRRSAGE